MKKFHKLWSRVKGLFQRNKKPVIRIGRENVWRGDKLARVLVPNNLQKFIGVLVVAVLLASCAGSPGEAGLPGTGGVDADITPDETALQAVDAAIGQLAQTANVSVDQIQVLSAERVEWPNACLGLPDPGEVCAEVVTPGFRVVLQANGQEYVFHTDESGTHIRQQ